MIPLRIRMTEERPPDVSQRKWREFSRESLRDAGRLWHTEFLPRHFRRDAVGKYGYKVRTTGYAKRKAVAFRRGQAISPDRPLVFTGFLQESLKRVGTIRAFPTRVTIVMSGPRYITMRPNKSNQPDKAAEATAVSREEEQRLSETVEAGVVRRINAHREPKTTTF